MLGGLSDPVDPGISKEAPPAGQPTGYTSPLLADPLVVTKRSEASSQGTPVPWLGANIRVTWPRNDLPTAQLGVTLHEGWGVNTGTPDQPVIAPLGEALDDHELVTIETARGDRMRDFRLFEGYLQSLEYGAVPHRRTATLQLVHIADILRTETFILGQYWIDKNGITGLADGTTSLQQITPRPLAGLDCVLNLKGRGNCHTLMLDLPSTVDTGMNWQFPVFCDVHDRQARSWNWACWLLHLLALPRLTGGAGVGEFTRHGFVDLPSFGDQTLYQIIVENDYHLEDADDVGGQEDPWARVLLGKPLSHACEGLSWLEALDLTCVRCGLNYHWESTTDVDGQARWGLRFSIPEAVRHTKLDLPSTYYETGDKSWQDVQEDANVMSVNIVEDYRAVVNRVTLAGAPLRREITVELVPGWLPSADWDVSPDDIDDAVDALGTAGDKIDNPWAKKYRRGGDLHNPAQTDGLNHWQVGRLWGLNTLGWWGSDYWRTTGPFTEVSYQLFDLASVRLGAGAAGAEGGQHAVRARRLLNCLTAMSPVAPFSPLVEVSYDGGIRWTLLQAGVQVHRGDLLVYLDTDDLRSVTQRNNDWPNAGMSLPEAYIRGYLHLRVTACIEIDECFRLPPVDSPLSRSNRLRHKLIERDADWAHRLRDDAAGVAMGNSQFNPGSPLYSGQVRAAHTKDDYQAASAEANRILGHADRVRWKGSAVLPGLVFPFYADGDVQGGYRPGDMISGISAEDSDQAVDRRHFDLEFLASQQSSGAVVDAIRWTYKQGEQGGAALNTSLQLEDLSRDVSMRGLV